MHHVGIIKTIFMKKKILLLLFAFLAMTQMVSAYNGLWLYKNDGTRLGFLFDEEVTMSYAVKSLVIQSKYATVEYPFEDVHKVEFADDVTSGVKSVKQSVASSTIRMTRYGIELSGFSAHTPVMVYDLSGRVLAQVYTDQAGAARVDMQTMPKGVYIVKAEKSSIKFKKD